MSWPDWLAHAGRPLVMGVVNVTPDSFSDGGRFLARGSAVAQAIRLVTDGADLLDIGGESTRPGAEPVSVMQQCGRIVPVIVALRESGITVPVFVDTRSAEVAAAALDAGADGVNDISALRDDPEMAPLVSERKAPIVLMHMQGTPATMQAAPRYTDVVAEVAAFLAERVAAASDQGVALDRIAVDPGIGFGKTTEHNLELLANMDKLAAVGTPVVVGPSRKRFIGELLGIEHPADRDTGTLGAVAAAILGGAAAVRVHETGAARQIVQLCHAIRHFRRNP
ncbi:MAG: dihydropteroate synthase [Phycisphaerae bacterium]|nr:dihydropteroate synthase [Phycisphaerae bacterium]